MENSLNRLLNKIAELGIGVKKEGVNIRLQINQKSSDFLKARRLLYFLINKFEKRQFILVENMPYCLMPDISSHIIFNHSTKANFKKIKACHSCKYCDSCLGWPVHFSFTKGLLPHAVADLPSEIVIEVTQKCNQDCLLCFSAKTTTELPLGKIINIIDEIDKLKIKTVRFTGGEPLLHKDIEKAIKHAKEKKLYVIVNTNVALLDKNAKSLLKNYVDNILISLQGFNYASERKLTKSSFVFKEKIKNIIDLNSTVPVVRLGTIITRTLIENLNSYHYLITKLKIKEWELYRPMTAGTNKEFAIPENDLLKILYNIEKFKKSGLDIKVANPIPFCIAKNPELSSFTMLGADADDGHSRMVFDSAGFFKPSYFIRKDLGTTIESSWNNHFLKKMRSLSYLPEKCKKCFYLKWCKGGSRYWANLAYGTYFSKDPLIPND